MKRLTGHWILDSLLFGMLISTCLFTQEKKELTVEWIYSDEAKRISEVHKFNWLENNTAILFDTRISEHERTFLKFDPKKPKTLTPIVDREKAVNSLQSHIGKADTTEYLQWPLSFTAGGERALYIYEHDVFLLNLVTSEFQRITNTEAQEKSARFSPDGNKVAFIRENDLYIYDIPTSSEKRLTTDGTETLLNGTVSWVYWEEIFGRNDIGYWWSDDSKALVYLQTDESPVTLMHYVDFKPAAPRLITQRYPKAGTTNPVVKAGIIEIDNPQTRWIDLGDYEYIARVKWLPDNNRVSIQTMNRAQTELKLMYIARATGKNLGTVLTETDPGWVNINDCLLYTSPSPRDPE